jgi:hypothetical protein
MRNHGGRRASEPSPRAARLLVTWLWATAGIPLAMIAGCAQVQQFTADDLANASALAGTRDPAGAACWAALRSAVAPTAILPTGVVPTGAPPTGTANGLATKIERDRLLELAMQGDNAPCLAVVGKIISELVRRGASAGFLGFLP